MKSKRVINSLNIGKITNIIKKLIIHFFFQINNNLIYLYVLSIK